MKNFLSIDIPKLPVFTTEEGIKIIKNLLGKLSNWKNINELIPMSFKKSTKLKKSGLAGIFAATLEMSKEGKIDITQKDLFTDLFIKEKEKWQIAK